ncbi:MAG TPA: 3'(2'),5'-bisphosphate nucleotidase CysQ [Candidatus Competibacteraceae bacterium]|nr:3'(2'),5'-bisphosphate nucleotidase CysQ [Candidatus Competibacteraceae bacterium]
MADQHNPQADGGDPPAAQSAPSAPPLPELLAPVLALAQEAAERILEVYRDVFQVSEKADRSPVTAADLVSHEVLTRGLTRLTPAIPVLSEESAAVPYLERRQWPRLWLVDPLDGTREFIKRNDEFSINIALVENQRAVFGLILMPVGGVCYYAWAGGGAYKLVPGQAAQPIHTRRIGPQQPVRIAGSRSYRGRPLQTYLEYLGRHDYLAVGSALKSCLVAEGKADLYPRFGPTAEWDTAAAQIILEEAGGHLTDTFMRPLRYNARPTLINPDFFAFGDSSRDWSQYLPRRKPHF